MVKPLIKGEVLVQGGLLKINKKLMIKIMLLFNKISLYLEVPCTNVKSYFNLKSRHNVILMCVNMKALQCLVPITLRGDKHGTEN